MNIKESNKHWTAAKRAAVNLLRNSDKWIAANKALKWDDVFDSKPIFEAEAKERMQRMNDALVESRKAALRLYPEDRLLPGGNKLIPD